MNIYREVLAANTQKKIEIQSQFFTLMNLGPGNVYIDFNADATTGVGSLLIPPFFGRDFKQSYIIKDVNIITDEDTQIQIDTVG